MPSPPLRGTAFITVVQPTDFRNGDNLAFWHDGPTVGPRPWQGQVHSGTTRVRELAPQQAMKVPRSQNLGMIQAFTTNQADSFVTEDTQGC